MSGVCEEKAPVGRTSGGAAQRLLNKLSACLASGDYYEAHQMYRTLHFRLLAKKSYDELLNLLYAGAAEFLSRGQQQSGVDVAILYVDVLIKANAPVDKTTIDKISQLLSSISSSIPERDNFIQSAIRWSKGESTHGHPLLHKNIAYVLWKERNYPAAQVHFYNSDDGASLAAMLAEMHQKQGTSGDSDLYIATATLQILCKKKIHLAQDTFLHYLEHQSNDPKAKKQPPFSTELLNFIWFLLQAVELKNTNDFKELKAKYDSSIKRDPMYSEYLKKIGRVWFDIVPPKSSSNGIFGNLIQNLLTNMETEDNEEETPNQPTAQSRMQAEDVE